jgi:DNA-binding YbaB/EbfC family protein
MNFGGGMGNILKQAQQMQARMAKAKEELALKSVEASAGGGAVKAVVTGDMKIQSLEIDPAMLKDADAAMLQDLVMAAVNQALEKSQEMAGAEMAKLTGGFKLPF